MKGCSIFFPFTTTTLEYKPNAGLKTNFKPVGRLTTKNCQLFSRLNKIYFHFHQRYWMSIASNIPT